VPSREDWPTFQKGYSSPGAFVYAKSADSDTRERTVDHGMPAPANPLLPEFYVYRFEAGGYPFYVGIGRAKRADDRLRYVRSLKAETLAKKGLSVRVMAALLKRNHDIKLVYLHRGLVRSDALIEERKEIARLIARGFMLTNGQHNPSGSTDAKRILETIISSGAAT